MTFVRNKRNQYDIVTARGIRVQRRDTGRRVVVVTDAVCPVWRLGLNDQVGEKGGGKVSELFF